MFSKKASFAFNVLVILFIYFFKEWYTNNGFNHLEMLQKDMAM